MVGTALGDVVGEREVRDTSIKYKVERDKRYLPYIGVRSLALQPLSAGNSATTM